MPSSEDSGEHPAMLPATAVAAIPHEAAATVLADHLKLNIAPPFSNERKKPASSKGIAATRPRRNVAQRQPSASAKAVTKLKRAPAKKDGDNDKLEDNVTKPKAKKSRR